MSDNIKKDYELHLLNQKHNILTNNCKDVMTYISDSVIYENNIFDSSVQK